MSKIYTQPETYLIHWKAPFDLFSSNMIVAKFHSIKSVTDSTGLANEAVDCFLPLKFANNC